jgi:Leucine-rich repeat (LRR) protein
LAGLVKLEQLKLGLNKIDNLSALSKLSNLKQLELDGNGIRNIEPLAQL